MVFPKTIPCKFFRQLALWSFGRQNVGTMKHVSFHVQATSPDLKVYIKKGNQDTKKNEKRSKYVKH